MGALRLPQPSAGPVTSHSQRERFRCGATCQGLPTQEGPTQCPPQNLPSVTTSWAGPAWVVRRPLFEGQHWRNPSSATSWHVIALLCASVSPSCRDALTWQGKSQAHGERCVSRGCYLTDAGLGAVHMHGGRGRNTCVGAQCVVTVRRRAPQLITQPEGCRCFSRMHPPLPGLPPFQCLSPQPLGLGHGKSKPRPWPSGSLWPPEAGPRVIGEGPRGYVKSLRKGS